MNDRDFSLIGGLVGVPMRFGLDWFRAFQSILGHSRRGFIDGRHSSTLLRFWWIPDLLLKLVGGESFTSLWLMGGTGDLKGFMMMILDSSDEKLRTYTKFRWLVRSEGKKSFKSKTIFRCWGDGFRGDAHKSLYRGFGCSDSNFSQNTPLDLLYDSMRFWWFSEDGIVDDVDQDPAIIDAGNPTSNIEHGVSLSALS
ncbi:hypothetical protein U1Q18_012175 [Sarracenia purpurea var. burkii]